MAETWLVAYDNSPCAAAALLRAANDASSHEAQLVVLHVVNELPPVAGYDWFGPGGSMIGWSEMNKDLLEGARAELERTVEALKVTHPAIEASALVRVGSAPNQILDVAAELSVDRIFIGTHGRGGLEALLFGSVAERVLRLAEAPVLVVKAPSPAAA